MGKFWDFVIDDVGPIVAWILVFVVLATMALWLFSGIQVLGKLFTVGLYRALVWERRGLCGICHQPFVEFDVEATDPDLGPYMALGRCPNGHASGRQSTGAYTPEF